MPDLNITIVLPSGGARAAEIPDDVSLRELMPELTSLLDLPTVGPDGRPMGYRLDSKALGRELKEKKLRDTLRPDEILLLEGLSLLEEARACGA